MTFCMTKRLTLSYTLYKTPLDIKISASEYRGYFMHFLLTVALVLVSASAFANAKTQTVKSKDLYIDGNLKESESTAELEKVEVEDDELKYLSNEFNNVKNLSKGFEKKNKVLTKLKGEAEKLQEVHSDYLDYRLDYEDTISVYNKQVECLKDKTARECQELLKRGSKRGKSDRREQNMRSGNAPAPRPVRTQTANDFDELEDFTSYTQSAPAPAPAVTGVSYVTLLDEVIGSRARELNACYRNYSTKGVNEQGLLVTILSIDGSGRLSHLGIEDARFFGDSRVISCVSSVLSTIQYPQPPGGQNLKIRKPFSFQLKGMI
jgi:hypothetical protein